MKFAKSSPVKLFGFGNHNIKASGSIIVPLLGSKIYKGLSRFLNLLFFEMSLQILKVSGPDTLIIAIPHGPSRGQSKIFILNIS